MKYTCKSIHPQDFSLAGPALIRKFFFPRQRLRLSDLPPVLGLSRDRLNRRIKAGNFGLEIKKDEAGRPFVRVEDLVRYLFPEERDEIREEIPDPKEKLSMRGRGRPRKAVSI